MRKGQFYLIQNQGLELGIVPQPSNAVQSAEYFARLLPRQPLDLAVQHQGNCPPFCLIKCKVIHCFLMPDIRYPYIHLSYGFISQKGIFQSKCRSLNWNSTPQQTTSSASGPFAPPPPPHALPESDKTGLGYDPVMLRHHCTCMEDAKVSGLCHDFLRCS